MGAYHQMGHDSRNLLFAEGLERFVGAVLSPVNQTEAQIRSIISENNNESFEMLFDPQLYYPQSDRGELPNWHYFPRDVDTADQSSRNWWSGVVDSLAETIRSVHPDAVCSPAVVPRSYSADYYSLSHSIALMLESALNVPDISILQTLIVRTADIALPGRSAEIASIVTSGSVNQVYLVFVADVEPRRELKATDELKGIMDLISYLERAGVRVTVAYACSDLVLWKHAGATHCASGKFFNLRRFTKSRFAEPSEGGGQVPYWFEENLIAFLKEPDVARIRPLNILSDSSMANPFGLEILDQIDNSPGTAWVALSWRQYLHWFADFESRMSGGSIVASEFLEMAERMWISIEDQGMLMEDRRNDGQWIRQWRIALREIVEA